MKKTYTVNINGRIYNIDDDAYTLLQNYLRQLHLSFPGEEGNEIVSDIESRISEIFDEKIARGANVIVISDVNSMIEVMGRPEELSDKPLTDENADAGEKGEKAKVSEPAPVDNARSSRKLFRNMQDKVFGGVIGGLAAYLGWNAVIMRVLYAALTVTTYFWPFTIVYLIAWMIIPAAVTPRQILEMHGEPVNLGTVGKTIIDTVSPPPYDGRYGYGKKQGFFSSVFGMIAKIIVGFLGFIGAVVGFGCTVVVVTVAVAAIGLALGFSTLAMSLPFSEISGNALLSILVVGVWCMVALIPAVALTWTGACMLFNCKGASRSLVIAAVIIEIILIAAGIILTSVNASYYYHYYSYMAIGALSGVAIPPACA